MAKQSMAMDSTSSDARPQHAWGQRPGSTRRGQSTTGACVETTMPQRGGSRCKEGRGEHGLRPWRMPARRRHTATDRDWERVESGEKLTRRLVDMIGQPGMHWWWRSTSMATAARGEKTGDGVVVVRLQMIQRSGMN